MTDITDLQAQTGAPEIIVRAMLSPVSPPLLRAVKRLTGRIQWVGTPKGYHPQSYDQMPTCWALDGVRVTQGQLLAAAGMTPDAGPA